MNKRLVLIIKIVVMLTVAILVGKALRDAWLNLNAQPGASAVVVDWRWGGLAIAGFTAAMLTAALVWRWVAWRMADRSATLPLIGAYTFSQMGKYIPGKVALLFMRVERAGRFGMSASVCTLSTLLENALYVISGGVVSMTAVLPVLTELRTRGIISARQQQLQWPLMIAAVIGLAVVCHPAVFYGVVNHVLRRMKKPEITPKRQLGMGTLALAILGFVPCWVFGGLALWASARCVVDVGLWDCRWFVGAYALSVIIGMISLLPGGLGIRELVLGIAVTLQISSVVGHDRAVLLGTIAAGLQRVFQVVVEVLLGVAGGVITGAAGYPPAPKAIATADSIPMEPTDNRTK